MKKNRYFSLEKLPHLLMLLSMLLLVACGGSGKNRDADDEDGDEQEETGEEEVADMEEADINGADLFDLLYDINAKADYAYAEKKLAKNGFRLLEKKLYDEDIEEYVLTFEHPDVGQLEVGWFGAVGFGLTFTTDSKELAEEVFGQAEARGFTEVEGADYMFSDGKCFFWKNDTGLWMYGRDDN